MATFPQLSTGAMTQFPFRSEVRFRSSRHEGLSGTEFSYEDPDFEERTWDVALNELSDSEWAALEQLFRDSGGGLTGFTFLDPTANLLAWSEALDANTWTNAGAGLSAAGAAPLEGGVATKITAGGGGALLSQSVAAPANYRYAGSVWARATMAGAIVRVSDGQGTQSVAEIQADGAWRRYEVTYPGSGAGDATQFAISVPPGGSVDVFGPQLEAQAAASEYKRADARSGIHPKARFDQDILSDRLPGPNRHSTRLRIVWTPSLV